MQAALKDVFDAVVAARMKAKMPTIVSFEELSAAIAGDPELAFNVLQDAISAVMRKSGEEERTPAMERSAYVPHQKYNAANDLWQRSIAAADPARR